MNLTDNEVNELLYKIATNHTIPQWNEISVSSEYFKLTVRYDSGNVTAELRNMINQPESISKKFMQQIEEIINYKLYEE